MDPQKKDIRNKKRPHFAAVVVACLSVVLQGCSTAPPKLYSGAEKSPEDLAYLVTMDPSPPPEILWFANIGGTKLGGRSSQAEVLPGEYKIQFDCFYLQRSRPKQLSPIMVITVEAGRRYEFYHVSGCREFKVAEFMRDTSDPHKVSDSGKVYAAGNRNPVAPDASRMYQLNEQGMRTNEQIQREEAMAREMYLQNEREQRELRGREVKSVGDQICRKASWWIDIGFVERVENGKLQIRIVRAQSPNNPSMVPGGFRETIIWDVPENWYRC